MACPVELRNDTLQYRQKLMTVLIVFKNIFAPVTARGDMIKSLWKFYSYGAGRDARKDNKIYATKLDLTLDPAVS